MGFDVLRGLQKDAIDELREWQVQVQKLKISLEIKSPIKHKCHKKIAQNCICIILQ